MMGHFFACIFLYIGVIELNDGQDSWLTVFGIAEEKILVQYMRSYYYAAVTMLTIGYGDITPKTNTEILICIIMMFIACGVFGYTLNSINQIFDSFQKLENEKRRKLIIVNNYMKKKHVSKDVQYQIREYLDYVWRESSEDAEEEEKIINQLSNVLREKLLMDANKIVLKDSPVFKNNFSDNVLQKTVSVIQEYKVSPEEVIFLEGDKDDCSIFFIEKGSVEIFTEIRNKKGKQIIGTQQLQTLEEGYSFGGISFFTGHPRGVNIRSSDFTTLLFIKRMDFLNILMDFPDDYERFCNIKDNVILNQKLNFINVKCHVCNNFSHLMTNCPFLHFNANKSKIIGQINANVLQNRFSTYKRKMLKQNFKKNIDKNTDLLLDFQDENESMLDEYELKNGLDLDQLQNDEEESGENQINSKKDNENNNNNKTDSTSSDDDESSQKNSLQGKSLTDIPTPVEDNQNNIKLLQETHALKIENSNQHNSKFKTQRVSSIKLVKDHQFEEIKEEQESENEDSSSSSQSKNSIKSKSQLSPSVSSKEDCSSGSEEFKDNTKDSNSQIIKEQILVKQNSKKEDQNVSYSAPSSPSSSSSKKTKKTHKKSMEFNQSKNSSEKLTPLSQSNNSKLLKQDQLNQQTDEIELNQSDNRTTKKKNSKLLYQIFQNQNNNQMPDSPKSAQITHQNNSANNSRSNSSNSKCSSQKNSSSFKKKNYSKSKYNNVNQNSNRKLSLTLPTNDNKLIDFNDFSPKDESNYLVMKGTKNSNNYQLINNNVIIANKKISTSQQQQQNKYISIQQQEKKLIAINTSGEIDAFQNKFNEEKEDEELNIFQLDFDETEQFPQIIINNLESNKNQTNINSPLQQKATQEQQLQINKQEISGKQQSLSQNQKENDSNQTPNIKIQQQQNQNDLQQKQNIQKNKINKLEIKIKNSNRKLQKNEINTTNKSTQNQNQDDNIRSPNRQKQIKSKQKGNEQQTEQQQQNEQINKQRSNSNHVPRRQSIRTPSLIGLMQQNSQQIQQLGGSGENGSKQIRRSSTLMINPSINRILQQTQIQSPKQSPHKKNSLSNNRKASLVAENPLDVLQQARTLKRKLSSLQNELTQPSINRLQRKSSLMMNSENQESVLLNQIQSINQIAQATVANHRRHSSLIIALPENNLNTNNLQQQSKPQQYNTQQQQNGKAKSSNLNVELITQTQYEQTLRVPSQNNFDNLSDSQRHLSFSSQCVSLQNQIQQIDEVKEDQNTKNLLLYWDYYKIEKEMKPFDIMKNFQFYFTHNNLDFIINAMRQSHHHVEAQIKTQKFTTSRRKTLARQTIIQQKSNNKRFSVLDNNNSILNLKSFSNNPLMNNSFHANGQLNNFNYKDDQKQFEIKLNDESLKKQSFIAEDSTLNKYNLINPITPLSMSLIEPVSSDRMKEDDQEFNNKNKEKIN